MKKFLEIYLGSRGVIESVEEMEFENIEKFLEGELNNLLGQFEEGEVDDDVLELFNWDKRDGGYLLGMGDEEEKVYVDVECEGFVRWVVEREIDLSDIRDEDVRDLLDDFVNIY